MSTSFAASDRIRQLSQAFWKFAGARLRQIRVQPTHPQWRQRAETCERCPLRVIKCGISYCGNPLLQQIDRDPTLDGCGCPCNDKAKSPDEHCPLSPRHEASHQFNGHCSCKWCEIDRLNP